MRESSLNKLSSQQSELDVSADMFQKFQQSVQKQNIGPSQLKQSLEQIIGSIHVEQWKNIPMPVCTSTAGLMTCINDLKKFSLYMEHRFSNLTASTNQSIIDVFNIAEKLKTDTEASIINIESLFNDKLVEMEQKQDEKLTQKLNELKNEMQLWAAEKTTSEINQLKPWVGKVADDKVINSERKQTADYIKRIKEVKDQFLVPDLIGPVGCKYSDFQEFVSSVNHDIASLVQSDEKLDSEIFSLAEERKKEELKIFETLNDLDLNLKQLIDSTQSEISAQLKQFSSHNLRVQYELQDKIRLQDQGEDIRVKTKLICEEWNEKVIQLQLIEKKNQSYSDQLVKLSREVEYLESQITTTQSDNLKAISQLNEQIQSQTTKIQELIDLSSKSNQKGFKYKGNKVTPKTIQPINKPTEEVAHPAQINKNENQDSNTLLKNSITESKPSIQLVDQEKQPDVVQDIQEDIYQPKPRLKLKKSSGKVSSADRLSKRSGSKTSQNSLKKQTNFSRETITQPQFKHAQRSRVQSAKPSTFAGFRNQESIEQIKYEDDINILKNNSLIDIDELKDRVRQVELQLIKIQRIQNNALQKAEKERKKHYRPTARVDKSLAGLLDLNKLANEHRPKSISNSPENRQLNANSQLNPQSRAPLQWEANKKRWVKESNFAPDLSIKIVQDQDKKQSRSRSREKNSKFPIQIIKDQPSSQNPLLFIDPSVVAPEKSQELYSTESNAYMINKSDFGSQKLNKTGALLNNPSSNGLAVDNQKPLFDKRQVLSREFKTDDSKSYLKSFQNHLQAERQAVEILQSHAQIYYKQEGQKSNQRQRPMTGVRAQDLTHSLSNFQQQLVDVQSSPRAAIILPGLKENKKYPSLSSASNKLVKLSSFNKI